jgi:hypothetical protein
MGDNNPEEKAAPVERLCSEIQLFDLCERETCHQKKGRYCGDKEMLAKFEAIKEEDERNNLVYEDDEAEEGDDLEYDELEGDGYEDDE